MERLGRRGGGEGVCSYGLEPKVCGANYFYSFNKIHKFLELFGSQSADLSAL